MAKPNIKSDFAMLQFDQPWELTELNDYGELARSATFDELLLEHVITGVSGPCLCINRSSRCLVTTVRESRMTNFEQSCLASAAQGWPVLVRCTGGSCVPQGPGVINFSVVHPKLRAWTLDDGYRLLCEFLKYFLASYGLTASLGEVPGSFCDGRYNLQIGGKKLVGTAQRWAGGSRENAAVLAHACLLVDLDLGEATEKINTLYRLCGNPLQFTVEACTTLRDSLGMHGNQPSEAFVTDVERRMVSMAREYFSIPG